MIRKINEFLEKIRNSEDNVKKRWLVVLSGGAMLIVLSLWVVYFNLTLPRTSSPQQNQLTKSATDIKRESKLAEIKRNLLSGLSVVKEKVFNRKNSISLSNEERNFQVEDLEEIPETKLP